MEAKIKLHSLSVRGNKELGIINNLDLEPLTSHIESYYHSYLFQRIPLIINYLTDVAEAEGSSNFKFLKARNDFLQLANGLTHRMMMEEKDLFSIIRNMTHSLEKEKLYNNNLGSVKQAIGRINDSPVSYMECMIGIISVFREAFQNEGVLFYEEIANVLFEFKRTLKMYLNVSGDVVFPASLHLEESLMK